MDRETQHRNRIIDLTKVLGDRPYRPFGRPMNGMPSFFGKVVSGGSMPSATGKYFLVNPGKVAGTPTENVAGTVAWDTTRRVPVYVFGSKVPVAGDILEVSLVSSGRWVAYAGEVCIADANHVCVCSCLTPVPKTLHTADGGGPITLTYSVLQNAWLAVGSLGVIPTYCTTGILVTCEDSFQPHMAEYTYEYKLIARCPGSIGAPGGNWELQVNYNAMFCSVAPFARYAWPNASCVTATIFTASSIIPFTCDFSLLSFNVPTSVTGLATPRGGGPMDVMP